VHDLHTPASRTLSSDDITHAIAENPKYRTGDVLFVGSDYRPDEYGFVFVDRTLPSKFSALDYGLGMLDDALPAMYKTQKQRDAVKDNLYEFSQSTLGPHSYGARFL
jgi:hypothetical protein